jgi:hypothetical protein
VYFRELACEYQKGGTPVRFDEPQDTKHADVKPNAAAAAVPKPTDKPPAAAAAAAQVGSKGEAKITSIQKLKIAKATANGDKEPQAPAPAAAPQAKVSLGNLLFQPSSDENDDEPPATRGPGSAAKSASKTGSPASHSQGKALQRSDSQSKLSKSVLQRSDSQSKQAKPALAPSDSQSSLSKPVLQRSESKSKQAKPAFERADSQSSLSKPVLQRSESKSNQARPAFERSDSQSKAERTGPKLVRRQAPPASQTKPVDSKAAPAARQLSLAEIKCPKSAKPPAPAPAPAAPTPARPASPSVDKLGTARYIYEAMSLLGHDCHMYMT